MLSPGGRFPGWLATSAGGLAWVWTGCGIPSIFSQALPHGASGQSYPKLATGRVEGCRPPGRRAVGLRHCRRGAMRLSACKIIPVGREASTVARDDPQLP